MGNDDGGERDHHDRGSQLRAGRQLDRLVAYQEHTTGLLESLGDEAGSASTDTTRRQLDAL
jgi:hypothetical protein